MAPPEPRNSLPSSGAKAPATPCGRDGLKSKKAAGHKLVRRSGASAGNSAGLSSSDEAVRDLLHRIKATQRYREGRIKGSDFIELKHWLESDPTVPEGKWYKRFKKFTLAGNGEMPS